MSLSGTINGSFSGISTTYARPKIIWVVTEQNIAGNYSDIVINITYYRYGAYYSYNASATGSSSINGVSASGGYGFDLRGTAPLEYGVKVRTARIYHNADGTKSCNISFSSDTDTSFDIASASATVTLDTIPRAATVTSTLAHTIGNNLSYTLTNLGSFYVKLVLLVWNGTEYVEVISSERGTGTSGEITLGATENNIMYGAMPSVTSRAGILRAYTYSDSGYTTQVGSYQDKAGTISINQATNKPTFTTFTVGNLDKTIANTDKYANVLVSSSTSTLLGADTKMIKNYSKLRAVILTANKMVALNYATAIKYRLTVGSAYSEQNYSADSTVNLDVDNATTNSVTVTAYDSRSLTTAVVDSASITNNANYIPVSLWGLTLTRDNSVDSETKLAITGSYWKEYFGGGVNGVQNTITAHYRYKETTASWGAQTWNAITLTDTAGALSFNDYINGDLGASGFDTEKSFDIEVRIYDKLTNVIVENSLPVGIPVMDWASGGIGIGQKFDAGVSASLQVANGIALDGTLITATPAQLNLLTGLTSLAGRLKGRTILTTGSGTYTPSAGVTAILVEVQGAGGSGGGGAGTATSYCGPGSGGGAGGYTIKYISSLEASYDYVVGAGGTAPTAGNYNGNAGDGSSFGTNLLTVGGGGGGYGSANRNSAYASNIVTGGGITYGGDLNLGGAWGMPGVCITGGFGWGGFGGDSPIGGQGGASRTSGGGGGSGTGGGVGAGGGGGFANSGGANRSGGVGGAGLIVIWEFS